MQTETQIEQRLTAVENAARVLQQQTVYRQPLIGLNASAVRSRMNQPLNRYSNSD
jgi:hypothetical protein